MGHPDGGKGNTFPIGHSFDKAYEHVGPKGVSFLSTTCEHIYAKRGMTRDNSSKTIVFIGE
jgi:hypothetical protein